MRPNSSNNTADGAGLSQAVSSFVRILGPGGASFLYALSIDQQLLGGNLIWVVSGLISILGVVSGFMIY